MHTATAAAVCCKYVFATYALDRAYESVADLGHFRLHLHDLYSRRDNFVEKNIKIII